MSRQTTTQTDDENANHKLTARLGAYAGIVIQLSGDLPDTKEGRHVRDQLLRAGTAPGAHYSEARSARSRKDFVHKLALAAKEARESLHWLRAANYAGMVGADVSTIIAEGDELVAILFQSLRTARSDG